MTYKAAEVADVLNLVVGEFESLNLVIACQVLQIASLDLIVAELDLQFSIHRVSNRRIKDIDRKEQIIAV